MIFRSSGEAPKSKFEASLKVVDVPERDYFIIKDEIKSGRSKFETAGTATGIIQRKKDGRLFQRTFKAKELSSFAEAFGEKSEGWVGKEIEITRYFSKTYQKEGLWANPIVNLEDMSQETPF